jgi:peptide/nickel transport system ATP-binding protein
VSDEVLVMRAGRVVERGATERVFGAPQHEYTRRLFASAPRIGGDLDLWPVPSVGS